MGSLHYGPDRFHMDDRTLAHVQRTIVSKLRKGEPFILSWDMGNTTGRVSLWIECGVPIVFQYSGSRHVNINRVWLDAMLERTYTAAGLDLMPENEYTEHPGTR